jgi:transposase
MDSIRKEEKMKKKISASLKLKIAIEAFKGDMTIGELASRYEVSPAQIHRWKRLLLDQGAGLFESPHKPSHTVHENEIQKLHANIGRLTVENDFLSRALGQLK